MKIQTKIIAGYAVISIFISIITLVALYGLHQVRADYTEIIDTSNAAIVKLREVQYFFTGQANDERGFLLTAKPEYRNEIQQKAGEVKQRIEQIKLFMHTKEEKDLAAKLESDHAKFTAINLQVMDLYAQGKAPEAQALSFGEGRKIRKDLENSFAALIKNQEEDAAASRENADRDAGRVQIIVLLSACSMILFGIVFGVVLSRHIVKPLHEITADMKSGNLKFSGIGALAKDEIGLLTEAFGGMVRKLQQTVLSIKADAESVAEASQQLTESAEQSAQAATQAATVTVEIAAGSEKQLAAVEQTRATVDQMNQNIQQIGLKMSALFNNSNNTQTAAKEGMGIIETSIEQMSAIDQMVNNSSRLVLRLGERSGEIGQIIDTIAQIANQTNLLALNAAIEAARAGEQGRGFAVVAEEVRKLAEESQQSAKRIANMIGEVQAETGAAVTAMDAGTQAVKTGTDVVASAGQSFKQIAAMIDEVSRQANEIASTMEGLSTGSREIVASVKNVEEVTQATVDQTQSVSASIEEQSASAEEIAASSQSLEKMADHLKAAVRDFKV